MPKVMRCPQCKGKLFVLCVEGQKKGLIAYCKRYKLSITVADM